MSNCPFICCFILSIPLISFLLTAKHVVLQVRNNIMISIQNLYKLRYIYKCTSVLTIIFVDICFFFVFVFFNVFCC